MFSHMTAVQHPSLKTVVVPMITNYNHQLLVILKLRTKESCNELSSKVLVSHDCKNDNFEIDNFLIFAQNIDCWYTLEPQSMF